MNIFYIKRRVSGIINNVGTRRGVFGPQHKLKSEQLTQSKACPRHHFVAATVYIIKYLIFETAKCRYVL